MKLIHGAWVLAAGMLMSCGDDTPPPSGNIEAWSDKYLYIVSPGDSVLSGVTLYNGTATNIVMPSCIIGSPYPVPGNTIIADGLSVLAQAPDQSWVPIDAGIPECVEPNPPGDVLLEEGFHSNSQPILLPTTPGRYSWVISYHVEGSEQIRQVATPAVTVRAP